MHEALNNCYEEYLLHDQIVVCDHYQHDEMHVLKNNDI